jgi:Hemerythrin HHE cation binding domain
MSEAHRLQQHASIPATRHAGIELAGSMSPSEVRSLVLRQHARIRELLDAVEQSANRLLATALPNAEVGDATRHLTLQLCSVMESHIALENDVLVTTLATIDAWGLVRAERLRHEHADQLAMLRAYVVELREGESTAAVLGLTASRLAVLIRCDMEHEEQHVLSPELFSDGLVAGEVETG